MSFLEPTVIGGLDRALWELLLVFAAMGGLILLLIIASIVGIIRAMHRRRLGKYSSAAVRLAAIAAGITTLWLLYWMGHDIRERSNPVNALFAINLGICVLPVAWLITAIRANAGRRERLYEDFQERSKRRGAGKFHRGRSSGHLPQLPVSRRTRRSIMRIRNISFWLVIMVLTSPAWSSTFSNGLAAAQTIDKSSVQFRLQVHKGFKGDPETWSWTPVVNFRVNGPFSPGGAVSIEYTSPVKSWKFDCAVEEAGVGWLGVKDCGLNPPDDQAVTYTGPVDFKINLRNELENKNALLFSGKFKVDKFHEGVVDLPKFKNNNVFYVNYDWMLPLAYIYDEWVYNWEYPGPLNRYGTTFNLSRSHLMAAFSFRGTNKSVIYSKYAAHLYYKGQMVAEAVPESAVCEVLNTPETNQDSTNAYCRSVFNFQKAMLWDKEPGVMEPGFYYEMYKNPGDYEIKVLQNGKLARTAKFTFGSDYKIADNGLVKQNSVGTLRVLVPAQIIGDQDGQWDRTAYKTDAFFGNPLTGFVWP